jgi:hypothetical protein
MQTPPWIDYITMENLPNEDLKIVAAIIGLTPTVQLMCEVPGMLISVPKNATLKARVEYVKKHYDGSKKSRYELSKTCGLSENYIYRVAKQR